MTAISQELSPGSTWVTSAVRQLTEVSGSGMRVLAAAFSTNPLGKGLERRAFAPIKGWQLRDERLAAQTLKFSRICHCILCIAPEQTCRLEGGTDYAQSADRPPYPVRMWDTCRNEAVMAHASIHSWRL